MTDPSLIREGIRVLDHGLDEPDARQPDWIERLCLAAILLIFVVGSLGLAANERWASEQESLSAASDASASGSTAPAVEAGGSNGRAPR